MSGSTKSEAHDSTTDEDFLLEHSDRLMAWELVHTTLATGKTLAPSRIATSVGLDTPTLYDIIEKMGDCIRNQWNKHE